MSHHLLALTTVANPDHALELARVLVDRRLVACVNILPGVRSVYRWKGEVADEAELVLVMKTRSDRYRELEAAVAELHPYDVPELVAIEVAEGAPAYLSWIDESLTPDPTDRSG